MSARGVLLVTGGGRGIGAATARLAGERGYAVCVNYRRDRAAADAVVRDIERGGEPQEVARAILWLLSDEASYSTGAILDVSGGR